MELKRVLAADSRAAKEKAMRLYGRDALILSNDRVNGQVELIVAVDLVAEDVLYPNRPIADNESAPIKAANPLIQPPPFGQVFQGTMQRMLAKQPEAEPVPAIALPVTLTPSLAPSPAPSPAPSLTPSPAPALVNNTGEQARAQELVAMVRAELEEMRREIRMSRQTAVWENAASLQPHIQELSAAMREANIGSSLRTLFIDEVKDCKTLAEATHHISTMLHRLLKHKSAAAPFHGTHVVVGPSGSGKTMMVRNIANAHIQLHGSEDIAVISFNDNRVGAWPQLQLLSTAAGIECYKVKSAESLRELVDSLSDKKLVIIDTPGNQSVENASVLNAAMQDATFHLVFPADASSATINRFLQITEIKWSSVMLTKLDECNNPWPLLQMLNNKTLPLSFESTRSLINDAENTERTIGKMIGIGIELLGDADPHAVNFNHEPARISGGQPLAH